MPRAAWCGIAADSVLGLHRISESNTGGEPAVRTNVGHHPCSTGTWYTPRAPQEHVRTSMDCATGCWIALFIAKKRPRGNRLAGPGKPAAGPDVTTTGTSSSDTQSRTQVPGVIGPRDDPKTAGLGPGSAPGRLESGSDPGPVRRPSATGGTGCPYQIYQRPRAQVALRSW